VNYKYIITKTQQLDANYDAYYMELIIKERLRCIYELYIPTTQIW